MSPFVIAASAAGLKGVPSVVNAIVITSAWSAQNQALLAGTRVLYGLALKRQAPKVFLKTTSWGVPWVCVLCFTAFMFLAFMSLSEGALAVFWWLVDLTACGVLISWSAILLSKSIAPLRKVETHPPEYGCNDDSTACQMLTSGRSLAPNSCHEETKHSAVFTSVA